MKKENAINLYMAVRDIKPGGLSRDTLVTYIRLRLQLKKVVDDFEVARQEISKQTKPAKWKDGDSTKKWEESYQPVAQAWLNEEVDIDSKIFTMDEVVELITANDLTGGVSDFIVEQMVKE